MDLATGNDNSGRANRLFAIAMAMLEAVIEVPAAQGLAAFAEAAAAIAGLRDGSIRAGLEPPR